MNRSIIPSTLVRALLAVAASMPADAATVELIGSPHSLIYRGPATSAVSANPGQQQPMRIAPGGVRFDMAAPRVSYGVVVLMMASQELARARFDPRLDGYFFQMPSLQGLPPEPACLYIRGTDGKTLPLRAAAGSDDGYEFRHFSWEQRLRANNAVVSLSSELESLNRRAETEDKEISDIESRLDARPGAAPAACMRGPEQAVPTQPAWAVADDTLQVHARHHCSVAVGLRLQAMQSRLPAKEIVRLAGINLSPTPSNLPAPPSSALQVPLSDDQLMILQKGLQMGQRSLEYEQGLESVRTAMNTCLRGMTQFASGEITRWATEKDAAARAPETSKLTCERQTSRLLQLRDGVLKRNAFRQAIVSRLDSAKSLSSSQSSPPERLESSVCNSRN